MSPARWLVLTVRVPSDELRDELAEGLVALGGGAVEETAEHLVTYVAEPPEPDRFLEGATARLAAVMGAPPELQWRWQADEDWTVLWKDGLAPREAGRIIVTQPWNPVAEEGDRIVIVIDPATAFGTGEHATTRGALRLMQSRIAGGERVLDVGAGSGVLAIAAVRLGARHVLAVESDPGSMTSARENLERNDVVGPVELVHDYVDAEWLAAARGAGYDLIVANVLSGTLVPLLPAFVPALTDRGRVILGGILDTEADAVTAAAAGAGLALEEEDREGEWWTAAFSR